MKFPFKSAKVCCLDISCKGTSCPSSLIPSMNLELKLNLSKTENILIIHNVRSVTNVGAMFRTADATGINKIYLTGYTPTPLDRFGRVRKDMAKSALGAEDFVSWEYRKNISSIGVKNCFYRGKKLFLSG